MPPAATTGTGETASTTAGTSAMVATPSQTCPPASHPCATMMSTPAATLRRASAGVPTVCITRDPASWMGSTCAAGSSQNSDTTGTLCSRAIRIRDSRGSWRMKLIPKGRSVSSRVRSMRSPSRLSGQLTPESIPRPPALLTAATSSAVTSGPIGACTIGTSMPRRSQSGVRSRGRPGSAVTTAE